MAVSGSNCSHRLWYSSNPTTLASVGAVEGPAEGLRFDAATGCGSTVTRVADVAFGADTRWFRGGGNFGRWPGLVANGARGLAVGSIPKDDVDL